MMGGKDVCSGLLHLFSRGFGQHTSVSLDLPTNILGSHDQASTRE
jgi:hypothetical protein